MGLKERKGKTFRCSSLLNNPFVQRRWGKERERERERGRVEGRRGEEGERERAKERGRERPK